ncbi:MAG TPA: inositol monophosphatase family protein [Nannocystaceae bacterium]|nr:inositol monophosphatase family protein [Nannocystaceae bacterium]
MPAVPIEAALAAVVAACKVARAVADRTDALAPATKPDDTPVTIADFAVQAMIVHSLRERDDGAPIVGEEEATSLLTDAALREAVVEAARAAWPDVDESALLTALALGHHRGEENPYWALDPIDGTKGFVRRQQYAVCLAHIDGEVPTIGVLGCPNLPRDRTAPLDDRSDAGAIYLAGPSGPAFEVGLDGLDVRPLVVHESADIGRAGVRKGDDEIVITHSVDTGHTRLDRVQAVLDELGRPYRGIPCDSQAKYALVARGQAHAYVRIPTKAERIETVWDHAAGAAIATRAGMIVTDLRGLPLDFSSSRGLVKNFGIVCAHPSVHAQLVAAVRKLGFATPRS